MAAVEAAEGNASSCSAALDPHKLCKEEMGESSALSEFKLLPDLRAKNGVSSEDEEEEEEEEEEEKDRQQKFKKYQTGYARYLKARYFSDKTYTGDDVFEEETKIGNETIRLSRFPILSAFTNPAKYLEEKKKHKMETSISNLVRETSSSSPPTKKQQLSKNTSL